MPKQLLSVINHNRCRMLRERHLRRACGGPESSRGSNKSISSNAAVNNLFASFSLWSVRPKKKNHCMQTMEEWLPNRMLVVAVIGGGLVLGWKEGTKDPQFGGQVEKMCF